MGDTENHIGEPFMKTVALAFGICALCFVAFAWSRVHDEYETWKSGLKVVTEMRHKHLVNWENDIEMDISNIATDTSFVAYMKAYENGDSQKLSRLLYPLKLRRSDSQYVDLLLEDASGNVVGRAINGCLSNYKPLYVASGFGLLPIGDSVFVTYKKEIFDDGDCLGCIVAVIDPMSGLSQIIDNQPSNAMNIVSHLYVSSGNGVIDLVPSEIEAGDTAGAVPSCMLQSIIAVSGGQPSVMGTFKCDDSNVIACITQLPASQWVLVSKIKIGDIRNAFTSSLLLGFFVIVFIAILMVVSSVVFHDGIKKGAVSTLMRREENLRAHAKKLQIVLDNISDAIVISDKNGKIWHINSVAQHLIGITERQAIGHNIVSIFNLNSGHSGDKLDNLFTKAMSGEKVSLPQDTLLQQINGREIPISGNLSPILNDLKKTSGLVANFRDESDKYYKERILEQGVESYDMIFDRNPHPMCIYEVESHKIQRVNQAACDMIGYGRDELLNMTLLDFSTPQFAALMNNTSEDVREKLLDLEEWEVIRHDGEKISLSKTSFDLMFNGKHCRHLLLTDLSHRRQIQRDMLGTQKRYKLMMNALPEAVVVHDVNNIITFVNQAGMNLFGAAEKKQLVGKNISILYHPDVLDSIKTRIKDMLENPKMTPVDERKLVKLDGSDFMAIIAGTPFVEGGKRFIQVLIKPIGNDSLNAGISGNEYRNIGNIGDLLIWKLDVDYNLTYVNEAWKRFVGEYGSKLGQGADWISLIHPDDHKSRVSKFKELCEKREAFQTEWRLLNSNGNYCWMLINAAPNYDANGVYLGYMGYCININRRRLAEIEMEKAKEQAEESATLKTTFLATLSHEIRTPMNAIVGFVDYVKEVKSREKIDEYLDIISENAFRLLAIVDDTMEMSKIDANQISLNISSFNVKPIVEIAWDEMKNGAKKDLIFMFNNNLPDNTIVTTDKGKVKQILSHLLDNAIKYTHPGGTITFDASAENDKLIFTIADTGIGVDAKNQTRIFETFYRVENAETMQTRGLGLGLPITKAYVEKLGGRMKFESSFNVGTIVTIELPSKQAMATSEMADVVSKFFSDKKGLVLLAEDDEFSAIYATSILESVGCKVKHVYDGDAAVKAVAQIPDIRLVLMDLQMPIMDGFEALSQIREIRPELPVVAQTNFTLSEFEHKIDKNIFNDVLNKPIRKECLTMLIEKYMGS